MKIFDDNNNQAKPKKGGSLGMIFTMAILGTYAVGGPDLFLPKIQDFGKNQTEEKQNQPSNNIKNPFADPLSLFKGKEITLNNWAKLPQSDSWYDKWRVSANGINDLKSEYAKSDNFKRNLNQWAQNTKRDFKEWKKLYGEKSFEEWKNSPSSKSWLTNEYAKSSKYSEDLAKWIALGPAKRSQGEWTNLNLHQDSFTSFKDTKSGQEKLQSIYHTKSSYASNSRFWIDQNNLTQKAKVNWILNQDFSNKYDSWKNSQAGEEVLSNFWKQSNDYNVKFASWLQKTYTRKTKDQWLNSSASDSSYNKWQALDLNKSKLLTSWLNTQDYVDAKNKWVTLNYATKTKDDWKKLPDAENKYNQWKAKGGITVLKNNWLQSNSYTSSQNLWTNTHFVETPIDTWKMTQNANDSLVKWENDNQDSQEQLKDAWTKQTDYANILNNWIEANYSQYKSIDKWLKTPEGKSYYNQWILTPEARDDLLFSFKISYDFAKMLQNWVNKGSIPAYDGPAINPTRDEYDMWKTLNSSQRSLFYMWQKTSDYKNAFSSWLANAKLLKSTKPEWENSSYSHESFANWAKSVDGAKIINDNWNLFASSDANLKSLVPSTFEEWKNSNYANEYFTKWSQTNEGIAKLKKHWKTTSYGLNNYEDLLEKWTYDPNNITKGENFLTSQAANDAYMEWRKEDKSRKVLAKRWKKTKNYQDVYNKWLATQDQSDPNLQVPTFNDELDLWSAKLGSDGVPINFDLFEAHDWKRYYYNWHNQSNLDLNKWLQNYNNGKKQGINLYLNDNQAQLDYQKWNANKKDKGELKDWENQVINGKTRVFDLYTQSNQSQKDYSSWLDPRDYNNFHKKINYSPYLNQWLEKNNNWYNSYVQILKQEKTYLKTNQFLTIDLPLYGHHLYGYSNLYKSDQGLKDLKEAMAAKHKQSNDFNTLFNHWISGVDQNNVSNKMNLYVKHIKQAKSDYQNWIVTNKKNQYQSSNQFNTDFNNWNVASNDEAFNVYLNNAQSDKDYNSWVDPNEEISYKASTTYNQDFTTWKNKKSNGLNLYQQSQDAQNDYDNWIDPNKPNQDSFALSIDYQQDLNSWIETKEATSNKGQEIYKNNNQSSLDYQLWFNDNQLTKDDYHQSSIYKNNIGQWISDYLNQPLIMNNNELWNSLYQDWNDPLVRRESNYQQNQDTFVNNLNHFIFTNNETLAKNFLADPIATNVYDNWDDPVGVKPNKEDYFATKQFVNDINDWSTNKNNGVNKFIQSAYAQAIFNQFKLG